LQRDAELGAMLRRQNRSFQLKAYVPAARTIEQHIQARISHYQGTRDFGVGIGGLSYKLALPTGIEPLYEISFPVSVFLRNFQKHIRSIRFAVGAKGDRCVVLCAITGSDSKGQQTPAVKWDVLGWFDPLQPPTVDQVGAWVDDQVVLAMESLAQEAADGVRE
jgi:hypothetical protein